jgi:hypothetical protein
MAKNPKLDENGEPIKPKRKHSPETIAKMSERRRARKTQPRSGTSKKRKNLYEELKYEYKSSKTNNERKLKENAEALAWLESNKKKLSDTAEDTKEMGILCEYHQQYSGIYEIKIGAVLYGSKMGQEEGEGSEVNPFEDLEDKPYEESDDFEPYEDLQDNQFC